MFVTAKLGHVVAAFAVVATAFSASPASPAYGQTGPFEDVPPDAFYTTPVTEMTAAGVFVGTLCDDGFCPDGPMDRKTMAVWVVRLLDGQDPPAFVQSTFTDVDGGSFHSPFIERMAELGVTAGCGDGSGFCPDRTVTRAQMAVFLTRAYDLAEGPDPAFGDVDSGAWYASEVAALAASGITQGCGDGSRFCPEQLTTRAQMATFLWRAEQRGDSAELAEQDSASGSGFDPATTPPLGDFDLERLVAAAATLDPQAVCPAPVVPEALEDVVEVLRIEGGCAVVEYELLHGRGFEETRTEILEGDPTAVAVGLPPIDIEPSTAGALDDDWASLVGGATLWHPLGDDDEEGHGPAFYAQDPPAPYDEDQYGPGQWWHLHRLDAATLWQPTGWEFTDEATGDTWQVPGWGSGEVVVAVLSSGVALHGDLGAVVGSGLRENLSWLDHACHHDDRTSSGGDHGTSLAGVIAAVPGNARDVAGLAPEAKVLPISIYGRDAGGSLLCQVGGNDITATVAVNAARERGADVISMSFWWNAYDDGPRETDCHGRLLLVCIGRYDTFEAALRLAQLDGIVTVDSVDNCGPEYFNSNGTPIDPNNRNVRKCPEGLNQRAFPSAYPGVIGVAAIDNNDDVADFSTRNEDVDIAAPGVNIRTLAPPQGVKTTNGTSIASPMISAVAAHMKARYPQASGYLIASTLKTTARHPDTNRIGGPRTDEYGFGIVDPVAAIEKLTMLYDEPTTTTNTTTTVPTVEGPASVTIAPGGDAQGEHGCSSRHCQHVSITLDAPDDTYDVECWSSRSTEPWGGGRWHWPSSARWNERGCWYGYPGEQIWVVVGGVKSNTITWPATTAQRQTATAGPIAFVRAGDIWIVNVDGSNERQLTSTDISEDDPSWSPDGSRILYTANDTAIELEIGDVIVDANDAWIMNADGTNQQRLTSSPIYVGDPTWSPDGRFIAYRRLEYLDRPSRLWFNYTWNIWVMSADGTNHRRLTSNHNWEHDPAWSNDSRWIAYAKNHGITNNSSDIWVVDLDGTYHQQLTSNSDWEHGAAWSPNGDDISYERAYVDDSLNLTGIDVWLMDADGSNQRRITTSSEWEWQSSWSPDGSLVAFRRGGDIWIMESDGTNQRLLVTSGAHPAWSPISPEGAR